MVVCGIVAFSVLIAQLYKVMIKEHDKYEQMAIEQQTRETTVSAMRGTIFDADGNVLAISATAYTVFISPYEIQKYGEDINLIASNLAEILDVDKDAVIEKSKDTASWYKTVATKIEPELADQVRAFKSQYELKGVHVENDTKRYYPNGSLACHVIGFVGTDNYGLEGIESVYNDYLEGTDGSISRLSTANGTELLYTNYENYTDATNGCDVKLTINSTIQHIVEKDLQQAVADYGIRNGGCAIVMEVDTGRVLAMACSEQYDLNDPWTISESAQEEIDLLEDEEEQKDALRAARLAQWRNTTISNTYEPGSVFKIFTMAMALEEGDVTEDDTFYCGGSMEVTGRTDPLNCWKHAGHGSQTLKQAAQHSCNVAFVNIGLKVGAETFYDYVESFGFWDKTGIDLLGEAGTRSLWWSRDVFCDRQNLSQLAAASFGQTFNVTPLQVITAVSAVANGGKLMEPYLVSEITNAAGEAVYTKEPTVVRQVISRETSEKLCAILESVVGEQEGTGKNAYVAGYHIAGKTGTSTDTVKQAAEDRKEYKVSFCGFAPANDPEIAVLVILDNPLPQSETGIYVSGGAMAAPVVGSILSECLEYLGVEPDYTAEELQVADVTMPKVKGRTVEEAKAILEAAGLGVRVVGDGADVTAQLPGVNTVIAADSQVILYAGEEIPEEPAIVPDLYGMTVKQARSALEKAGLFMKTSGASPGVRGVVVSTQSVSAGSEAVYGSVVRVTLLDNSNLGRY